MTQGYPPYNNRDGNQQPPPYQGQGQWQPQQPYPPQGAQQPMPQGPPSQGGGRYYPGEKQEYYSSQPAYGGGSSSSSYPTSQANYQPPYGPPPTQSPYQQPSYGSPNPTQAYPPQPSYGSSPPPQVPYSSHPTSGNAPKTKQEEEDEQRGILGAMSGAAAGGYAGHKMGSHGIIGALGGVFAGHKLEEAYKTHNQKPIAPVAGQPPMYSQQPPMYQQQGNYGPPPPQGGYYGQPYTGQAIIPQQPRVSAGGLPLLGNFSSSSSNIYLSAPPTYDLVATLNPSPQNPQPITSGISLNQYLTNNNGNFLWVSGGGNFGASARNVRLTEGGTVLEAELRQVDGGWNSAKAWLDEKFGWRVGQLVYLP